MASFPYSVVAAGQGAAPAREDMASFTPRRLQVSGRKV